MGQIGQLRTQDSIEKAMRCIRDWLSKIRVDGLSINTNYDNRMNVALLTFKRNGKAYEFRSSKQSNARLNMWGIARVMEYKVRSHLMGIEEFDKSMAAYLQIENKSSVSNENNFSYADSSCWAILGISALASNDELLAQYKKLAKTWHPDMAGSEEAKAVFQKKFSEINQAWAEIKKERGL